MIPPERPAVNTIVQGHVLDVLRSWPDEFVDCCVCSPPYWSLRDYKTPPQVWDDGWLGSLGLEPTFELYLSHLFAIFDEVKRVLKPQATCFVNLGDSYAGSGQGFGSGKQTTNKGSTDRQSRSGPSAKVKSVPAKSLCLIPQRFVVGMVERGWICRNEIIWKKNSCMPESVKDRFTRDFEHVFFFTKSQRYFFEQQFEQYKRLWDESNKGSFAHPVPCNEHGVSGYTHSGPYPLLNSQGRNMRCVWEINPKPFKEAHFATYAPALVERCLRAGCPEFVCKKCGKGRKRIYKSEFTDHDGDTKTNYEVGSNANRLALLRQSARAKGTEYRTLKKGILSDCSCGAGFLPSIVLDPFLGSGTTALVALSLNRSFIGIELSDEYVKMSERRLAKPIQVKI